jgi:dihydroorotate dehydrogenase electron transfer subunit
MNETIPATGRVLVCQDYPGDYALLRVTTRLAGILQPGQALRIEAAPWAILQPAPEQGWVDCLQRHVPRPTVGHDVLVTGPVGEPFDLDAATPRALLLADDDGIAQIVFLARVLRNRQPRVKPFALFDLTPPLPFRPQPSRIMTPGLPAGVIAALPLLEDWGIPGRIACPAGDQPGCFEGTATELARGWLEVSRGVADVTVFACGGSGLVEAARNLADTYGLASQTRPARLP